MWDKEDYFGRRVQFICAIPLLLIGGGLLYWSWADFLSLRQNYDDRYSVGTIGVVLFVLGGRCLWYAVTGRDNVNNKDF